MKTRVSTEHAISNRSAPIAHGVMRFDLDTTTLSGVTNTSQIIKLSDVATGTHVIVEDVWMEVTTAFTSGTTFGVGDGLHDNSFLRATDVASTGLKSGQTTKGVLLTNNSTAVITSKLTLRVSSTTALSQQSAGSASLYVAFKEIFSDCQASDIASTSSESALGDGTIPTFGGGGLQLAGTSGQIQYNDGNGQLAAYSATAARTQLGLEVATADSSSAGGKVLKVSSSGVTSGSLLSLDSSGEIVTGSLSTQSITQDTYPFGAVEVLSTGVVTSVKSNTHETNNIALTSPGSYALSAYQALPTRSNSYDTNPFYSHYVVTNSAHSVIVSGIEVVKYPDPNGYAEGTTFTVSFAHCNDQFSSGATVFEPPNPYYDRDDSTSTSYNLLNVKQMLGLVPDSGSFTGNPFICADTDHAFYYSGSGSNGYNTTYGFAAYSNECPLFLLSPGGSVTLSVVTARDASNASKKTWQIIAHYDRYPQYVLKTGTMPYSG